MKALSKGWIDECCKHMMTYKQSAEKGKTYIWTKETIMEEVKKHKEFSQLMKANPGMMHSIKRLNLEDIIKAMIPTIKEKWTYEKLKAEALKYNTRKEMSKNSRGAIGKIYKLGLANELLSHMKTKSEQTRYWTDDRILKAIIECGSKNALKLKYPGAYIRTLRDRDKYSKLFKTMIYNIELDVLHPNIIKILNKHNTKFLHHKKLKIGEKLVIPDFMFQKSGILYVIEAKSSGTFFNYCLKEIEEQIKDQIDFVSHFNKNKKIVHILLSEEGLVKAKNCDYNMSLKEFNYFIRYDRYKCMPSNYHHKELSNKIRKNYLKIFF